LLYIVCSPLITILPFSRNCIVWVDIQIVAFDDGKVSGIGPDDIASFSCAVRKGSLSSGVRPLVRAPGLLRVHNSFSFGLGLFKVSVR